MVTVEIQGKPYRVSEGVTAVQALWQTGHRLVKGIGCLGGVCGACVFSYRKKGEMGMKTGLACQTPVEDGLSFAPPASLVLDRPSYRIGDDPGTEVFQYFPETRRCTRCNACTMVCPQRIDVKTGVVKVLSGEFAPAAETFYDCVMCGLCAVVCDEGIKPNLVGLYARRAQGARLAPFPENLLRRLEEVQAGAYAGVWAEVSRRDPEGQVAYLSKAVEGSAN